MSTIDREFTDPENISIDDIEYGDDEFVDLYDVDEYTDDDIDQIDDIIDELTGHIYNEE